MTVKVDPQTGKIPAYHVTVKIAFGVEQRLIPKLLSEFSEYFVPPYI